VRNLLSEGMQIAALHHTEMAGELSALQAAVSSTVEFTLGRLPNKTVRVEVVDELVAEFYKKEERLSRHERPGMRIYDPLLGSPSSQGRLSDQLEEAAGWLGVEQVA
jgi:hypothetical protein